MRYIRYWFLCVALLMGDFLISQETYTVQRGDNLLQLSIRFGTTVEELKSLNRLSSDAIQVGQKLIVRPGGDGNPIYYEVKAGDTLSSIARRHNTSVSQLVSYNDLKNSNIRPRQRLIVGHEPTPVEAMSSSPNSSTTPSSPDVVATPSSPPIIGGSVSAPPSSSQTPNPTYHIVVAGETLSSISRQYDIDVIDLVEYNKLTNFLIIPGQRIYLQDGHITDPPPFVPPAASSANRPNTHTVRRGDTLYSLANFYGVTVDDLRRWNRLSSVNINVGQVLYLQEAGATSRPPARATSSPLPSSPATILPVFRINILSEFGMRRGRMHKGIDLGGNNGDPISTVMDGTVVFSGWQRGFGNVVIIEHTDGIMTLYAHNDSNLVRVGEKVTSGQIIARMGRTGNASTNHLHFEYRLKGVARNPRELLRL